MKKIRQQHLREVRDRDGGYPQGWEPGSGIEACVLPCPGSLWMPLMDFSVAGNANRDSV